VRPRCSSQKKLAGASAPAASLTGDIMEISLNIKGSEQEVTEFFTALVGQQAGSLLEKLHSMGALSVDGPDTSELSAIVQNLSWSTIYMCHALALTPDEPLSLETLREEFAIEERAAAARVGGLVKVCTRKNTEPFIRIRQVTQHRKEYSLRKDLVPALMHYVKRNDTDYRDWLTSEELSYPMLGKS